MRARMALKLANIKCEIREVRLNNKPKDMLEASPKGTVPILILEDKIIDESIDIINWTIKEKNIFDYQLSQDQIQMTEILINHFDDKFKHHLDRYKYSTRYKENNRNFHRNACLKTLINLETNISGDDWIFGYKINKLDIAILPFIRQYRIADPEWFDSLSEIKKVQKLLNNFLKSDLFNKIMYKYDEWKINKETVYFPPVL
tara:strand:- start:727 stop:1332 length:606 start_codon:yes stop_codon:yes gene_type:complete